MKSKLKQTGAAGKLSLLAAILTLASLVAFLVYGGIYSAYSDVGVAILLAVSLVVYAAYAILTQSIADILPLAGVIITGIAMGNFIMNSYPVWGDWYGNFNMYGSEGGIAPVIVILVIMIISILSGIVTCFVPKKGVE